ncbi:hypothetical protein AMR42_15135 [Limnothrix sp. PR1529]|nr:hypothetical protein AMR42_15135 [Limnothrix sp. PR1529]
MAPTPAPGNWSIESVSDGDTVRITNGRNTERIRLCGIDAPEKAQERGKEARDHLVELVRDRTIRPYFVERDKYGRQVAELFAIDETGEVFVNEEMARSGLAWHYARYSGNCPNRDAIAAASELAIAQRAGVHGDAGAIAPWEWRRQNKR